MNLLWSYIQEHAPAAGQAAAEHAESPNVFAFTWNVSFWTFLIFLILLGVLIKFAFPPILGYANAREKRIQDTLDETRRQQEEAARLLEEQRQQLAQARSEAQQVIAEGRSAAEKVRQELLSRARIEQEELIARAKADIETERARAVESVRREAVEIALAAASRLIEQRLDKESDRKLVSDYLVKAVPTAGAAR